MKRINHFKIKRISASKYLRKKPRSIFIFFYSDRKACPFCLVPSPSVQAALLVFHFLSTTSSLPLAVQTLNYSKDAEHSSSSPVSQIPLYNPQRNLLLCTRWIVFVAVFITGGGGALRFLRVVASDSLLEFWWHMKWSEEVSVSFSFFLEPELTFTRHRTILSTW